MGEGTAVLHLGVDFLVDGALGFLLLLHGQQLHQRFDGHALRGRGKQAVIHRELLPL